MKKLTIIIALLLSISSCNSNLKKLIEENGKLKEDNSFLKNSINRLTKLNYIDTISPVVEMKYSSKIIYRGIKNFVKIAVPFTDSIKVKDNDSIIKPIEKNEYLIEPPKRGRQKTIQLISYFKNKRIDTIQYNFEVREIGKTLVSLNGKKGVIKMSKESLKNGKFDAYVENYIYDSYLDVYYYKVLTYSSNPKMNSLKLEVEDNKITDDTYKIISNLNIGDTILFYEFNVKYKYEINNLHGCGKYPPPIFVEISK